MRARPAAAWATHLVSLVGGAACAYAQSTPAPDVPEVLKVPPGERLVLPARASGAQIYACTAGADGKLQWTLTAPDAQLRDEKGTLIGHHGAGPSWKHTDGSEATGKASARVEARDADSIPWLLLSVVSHDGNGVLGGVTYVQRLNTHGGQPPPAAECNATKRNAQARIPYSADYYFYAPEWK